MSNEQVMNNFKTILEVLKSKMIHTTNFDEVLIQLHKRIPKRLKVIR